jgi:SPP1 family predicted phage head-tail adaptor
MLAAQLDQRVTIERLTNSVDALGTPVKTWATLAEVAANVKEGTGNNAKSFNSNSEVEGHSFMTIFKIRHLLNFGYDCRIVFDGEQYEIKAIEKLRRLEGFNVTAQRSVNNA